MNKWLKVDFSCKFNSLINTSTEFINLPRIAYRSAHLFSMGEHFNTLIIHVLVSNQYLVFKKKIFIYLGLVKL